MKLQKAYKEAGDRNFHASNFMAILGTIDPATCWVWKIVVMRAHGLWTIIPGIECRENFGVGMLLITASHLIDHVVCGSCCLC